LPAAQPFPWRDIMAFGLGRLGWTPEAFWKATPREIGAALRAHQGDQPSAATERSALRSLMAAHPDA
jgi:uncharacterized phage protein (TIGR02216 family)